MNESMEQLKNSYVSTENQSQKRIVLVQDVTEDSRDDNSIINDTLTDDLDGSVEQETSASPSKKKKDRRIKRQRTTK